MTLTPAALGQKYLILHDFFYIASRDGAAGTAPIPEFVRDNKDYLETTPFDGVNLYVANASRSVNATRYVFSSQPVSYAAISDVLSPIRDLQFTNLTHNFAFVLIDRPADWFDDWSVPVQNFRNLARAAREAGLKGILLDNEQYYGRQFNYPNDVKYQTMTLDQYRAQAHLRGQQIMQAVVAEFPGIEVLIFHGPYVSSPNAPFWTPQPDRHPLFQRLDSYYELLGPFFAGLVDGASSHGTVIDGGSSLKHFRADIDYEIGYQFRKFDIASAEIDSPFIPLSLRPYWSQRVQVAYTLYDRPIRGQDMNPDIARETLPFALRRTDKYVWVYTEAQKFLLPPSDPRGAPLAWLQAIRGAKEEVLGPKPAPQPPAPQPPALPPPPEPAPTPAPLPPTPPPQLSNSVNPSSGTGAKQKFAFTFRTLDGSPVSGASILVSEGIRKGDSCWLSYNPATNLMFLADDDLSPWFSHTFGTTGSIRNSQCLVLLGGSRATPNADGSELTLEFSLWFLDPGPKDVYLKTSGASGYDSGYVLSGGWNVP